MTSAPTARGSLTLSTEKLPVLVQVGQEEAVDQCGLPQARLTCPQIQGRSRMWSEGPRNRPWPAGGPSHPTREPGRLTSHHEREIESLLHRLPVHLVRQRGEAHVLLVNILGAGAGQVRGTLGLLGSPMPSPIPARVRRQQRTEPPEWGISMGRKG